MHFAKVIFVFVCIVAFGQAEVKAQLTKVNPVSSFSSVNSDDPLRFFHPADFGFNGGDINGDGIEDFINHTNFSADLNTPQLGDFTDKSLICNYDDTGTRTTCSFNSGNLLYPAGDLNNDGRDDLAAFSNGMINIYSFPTGPINITNLPVPIFQFPSANPFQSVAPGHDLDGDGFQDLIVQRNSFDTGSSFSVIFGNSNPANGAIENVDTDAILGDVDISVNAGDVTGDASKEIVLLTSTGGFPCNRAASIFEITGQREITNSSTTDLGTCSSSVTSERFYVANADGEHKDDLLYSDNRYSSGGGGFVQVFINNPSSSIVYSTPGETPFSQPRTLRSNQTIDQVATGASLPGNIGVVFSNRVNLEVCFGVDMLSNGEGSGEACSNPQNVPGALSGEDQIFLRPFLPIVIEIGRNPNGGFINGVLRQQQYAGGIVLTDPGNLAVISAVQSLFNLFSPFRNIQAVMPQGIIGGSSILLTAIPFSNGFISIPITVGNSLALINEDNNNPGPVRGDLGRELVNIFDCGNTNQCASGNNFISFLGSQNSAFWFGKANANETVATEVHRINVTDFQALDNNSFIRANNVGDINDDGMDDIVIAPGFSTDNGNGIHELWIFYGEATPSKTMPDVTIDLTQEATISASDFIGAGVSIEGVGDVNGDGVDDFAVGLTQHQSTGSVFVYFGESSANKVGSQSQTFALADVILRPVIEAGQFIFGFGGQIAGGDFDGDGFNDIAVTHDGGSGDPVPPFIRIFRGGSDMDNVADFFPALKRSDVGGDNDDPLLGAFGHIIQFLPKESGDDHQDFLFIPGVFSGFPDAAIFSGGTSPDNDPDTQICGPNQETGFGFGNRNKAVAKDLNGDGFYEIVLVNELDNEDSFVSSRAYVYSPNSGITVSTEDGSENPFTYRLSQNYPNPFNPTTNIEFLLPQASNVSLKVYDLLGREVATILNNVRFGSGSQTVPFNASALSSGIYLYRLEAGSFTQTRKMTLIK